MTTRTRKPVKTMGRIRLPRDALVSNHAKNPAGVQQSQGAMERRNEGVPCIPCTPSIIWRQTEATR